MDRVKTLIETLDLEPHPERGFYAETFRAPLSVEGLPHGAPRAASTAIYFLLTAAELDAGKTHCLFGCTVAPGFDFADFELAEGPELAARHPEHVERIRRLTRPAA